MVFRLKKPFFLFLFLIGGICSQKLSAQSVGLLYGLSFGGGSFGGTLFSYDPLTNKDSALIDLDPATGYNPYGSLVQASNGLLYGMTSTGGQSDSGTIFSYNTYTNQLTVILNLNYQTGDYPSGNLIQASDGLLYGMTTYGGAHNEGVLFAFSPLNNSGNILINFDSANGKWPYYGGLAQGHDGRLYGSTPLGGKYNKGVLFRYDPIIMQDTVLINFFDSIGDNPYGGTMVAGNGLIYGMTSTGVGNGGVIFSYDPVNKKDTFYLNLSTANGFSHEGCLLQATDSLFYGMDQVGGSNGDGTLFRYNPATGQDTVVIPFDGTNGFLQFGTPMQASDSLLYCMTYAGGSNNAGTIVSYNLTTHKDSLLINFNGTDAHGPYGNLIEALTYTISGKDTVKCYGDSSGWAKITTRGGKMPVTYHWSTGSTNDSIGNLKGGLYTCSVNDASGKDITITVNIIQPAQLLANLVINNACIGNNDSAWASPIGGTAPYSFLWSNSSTNDTIRDIPSAPDTIKCIVTDAHGCIANSQVIFANPAPLKIDSVRSTPPTCDTCNNGTATVYTSGGVPPGDSTIAGYQLLYLWTRGGDSATVRGLPPGYDSITVTNECGSVVGYTKVPMGIPTINALAEQIKLYPVPTDGRITISMYGDGFEGIIINDELGREVYHNTLDASNYNYTLHPDLSNLPNGIYIVQLVSDKGTITRKLIIAK